MENVAALSKDQRMELFRETATRRRISNVIAEKDFLGMLVTGQAL